MKRYARLRACSVVALGVIYMLVLLTRKDDIRLSEAAFAASYCKNHVCKPGVRILEVRNTDDLRACISASGERFCVFTRSGYYEAVSRIPQ